MALIQTVLTMCHLFSNHLHTFTLPLDLIFQGVNWSYNFRSWPIRQHLWILQFNTASMQTLSCYFVRSTTEDQLMYVFEEMMFKGKVNNQP